MCWTRQRAGVGSIPVRGVSSVGQFGDRTLGTGHWEVPTGHPECYVTDTLMTLHGSDPPSISAIATGK